MRQYYKYIIRHFIRRNVTRIVSYLEFIIIIGSIGLMALCYYLTTTTIGITLCVVLVETIRPGELIKNEGAGIPQSTKTFMTVDTILDLFR